MNRFEPSLTKKISNWESIFEAADIKIILEYIDLAKGRDWLGRLAAQPLNKDLGALV